MTDMMMIYLISGSSLCLCIIFCGVLLRRKHIRQKRKEVQSLRFHTNVSRDNDASSQKHSVIMMTPSPSSEVLQTHSSNIKNTDFKRVSSVSNGAMSKPVQFESTLTNLVGANSLLM
eukprot:399859_1